MQVTEVLQQSKRSLNEAKIHEQSLNEANEFLTKILTSEFNKQLALLEELDLKQVSGGDWMVWDTATDSPAATTRFASPGEAEEYRDTLRRQRTGPISTGDDDLDNKRRRLLPRARVGFRRGYRRMHPRQFLAPKLRNSWVYLLAAAIGITVDYTAMFDRVFGDYDLGDPPEGMSDNFQEYLDYIYLMARAGYLTLPKTMSEEEMERTVAEMSDEEWDTHYQKNMALYDEYIMRTYAVVIGAYWMATLAYFIPAALSAGKATISLAAAPVRNIKKFITALRAIRLSATALSAGVGAAFGAGVGGIVTGLITYLLGSGVIWFAEWLLLRSGMGASVVQYIVNKTFEWDMSTAADESSIPIVKLMRWATAGNDAAMRQMSDFTSDFTTDEIQRNLNNMRDEVLRNPQFDDQQAAVVDRLAPSGSSSSTSSSSNSSGSANPNDPRGIFSF